MATVPKTPLPNKNGPSPIVPAMIDDAAKAPIKTHIPVKLAEVKVVFSIASLSLEGDLPASLFHMGLIVNDVADWKAKSQIVALFHTNAGHVTLHDTAYNADRSITTGNPYKGLVAEFAKEWRENRTVWCHGEGSQLWKCGFTPRHQDQHRRYGDNNAACSGRFREDLGIIEVPNAGPV